MDKSIVKESVTSDSKGNFVRIDPGFRNLITKAEDNKF
jgi:hypothetical protein